MSAEILLQYFDKYYPDNGSLYKNLEKDAKSLKELGITAIWLPPPTKTINTPLDRMGYGIFDRYDLGEFNQAGSVRTKYGTKNELISAINVCHSYNLKVYLDIVLNHLCALPGDADNENFNVTTNEYEKNVTLPTYFNYKKRNNKYNSFKWNYKYFNIIGQSYIDWIFFNKQSEVDVLYYIDNKQNDTGKYNDYLVGMNVCYKNNIIIEETLKWVEWLIKETNCDGLRLDAAKHLSINLLQKIVNNTKKINKNFIFISEYMCGNLNDTMNHINILSNNVMVFDDLLYNSFRKTQWRNIFYSSVAAINPQYAITYVNNHDNQDIEFGHFKKHFYALILFKKNFGIPCIFNKDRIVFPYINKFLNAKKKFAFGDEYIYTDIDVFGFTRVGLFDHSKTMAVIMSLSNDIKEKKMYVRKKNCKFIDLINKKNIVISDDNGFGLFYCNIRDVTVWIQD
jgi:alpha-amylase